MSHTKRTLPGRALNPDLSDESRQVLLMEAVAVAAGDVVSLRFQEASPVRRQGVWLATEGRLGIADEEGPQFVVWTDTAPASFDIRIVETDGLLRFYNVWGRDGGLPGHESQLYGSGMIRRELDDRWTEYSCANWGMPASFGLLVFSIRVVPKS